MPDCSSASLTNFQVLASTVVSDEASRRKQKLRHIENILKRNIRIRKINNTHFFPRKLIRIVPFKLEKKNHLDSGSTGCSADDHLAADHPETSFLSAVHPPACGPGSYKPAAGKPAAGHPETGWPVDDLPVNEDPTDGCPAVDNSSAGLPVADNQVAGKTAVNHPDDKVRYSD